jgi:hypothetical protein
LSNISDARSFEIGAAVAGAAPDTEQQI